ncbi:MAG: hypothetical protein IAE97_06305 [Chthoniobacterales bacterium]|nr:hypothetical protein [Chthoniobacterales bacterium]
MRPLLFTAMLVGLAASLSGNEAREKIDRDVREFENRAQAAAVAAQQRENKEKPADRNGQLYSDETEVHRLFLAEVEMAKQLAVDIYPDTTERDSRLCKLMVEIDNEWRDSNNPFYYSSMKPVLLAHLAAAKLGIAPQAAASEAIQSQARQAAEREQLAKEKEALARQQATQAAERERLAREKESLAQQQAVIRSTQAGFNAFVEEQRNLSGPRQIKGGSSKAGARYSQGPWKGKTQGEGMEMAIRQWEAMSDGQKMAYERRATLYGSAGQYRQDSPSPSSNRDNYISNTGQRMASPENASVRQVLVNGESYIVTESGDTTVVTGGPIGPRMQHRPIEPIRPPPRMGDW